MINVKNIPRAAQFWCGALGYVPHERTDAILVPPSGGGPVILLDEDDRMHLDLWTANEKEQQAEVERLLALGAKRVDWVYPEGADFVVLADSEGNLFCVINTEQT